MTDPDQQFFADHPDRWAHIRKPRPVLEKNMQRSVRYVDEMRGEFWSLGEHDHRRRRVLLWRVPRNNPFYDPDQPPILKIPFLAFADESIEDTDAVLLPIIHQLMLEAAQKQGVR